MSFFAKSFGSSCFFYGNPYQPQYLFLDYTQIIVCGNIQELNYCPYVFRDVIMVPEGQQNMRILTSNTGTGTNYRSIVITAEKL